MAVLLPRERSEPWAPTTLDCFLCGAALERADVAIHWHGTTALVLHVACAERLGVHLIQDAREALLAAGAAKHWAKRAARAAGAALRAQEGVA
jgi:hypothetical protein